MSDKQRHVIQVAEYELHISNEEVAEPLFAILSRFNGGMIKDLIEKYCNKYSSPHAIHRFETLELDLGRIPAATFESKFLSRLEDKLSEAFEEAFNSASKPTVIRSGKAGSELELFVFYLVNGALPWWAEAGSGAFLEDLAARLAGSNTDQLQSALLPLLRNHNVRCRLAAFMKPQLFQAIVQLLSGRGILVTDEWPRALRRASGKGEKELIVTWRRAYLQWYAESKETSDEAFFRFAAGLLGFSFSELVQHTAGALLTSGSEISEEHRAIIGQLKLADYIERFPDPAHMPKGLSREEQDIIDFTFLMENGVPGMDAGADEHSALPAGKENSAGLLWLRERYREWLSSHPDELPPGFFQFVADALGHTVDSLKLMLEKGKVAPVKSIPPTEQRRQRSVDLRHSESEESFIDNAGLVLLSPFLPRFFSNLGLVADNKWIDDAAQQKAIAVLYYLVTGSPDVEEFRTPFLKVVCGLQPTAVFEFYDVIDEATMSECSSLLESVIAHAPVFGNLSVDGFRGTYLLRSGLLGRREGNWLVQVEKKTLDILLQQIPWSYRLIKLPWMPELIVVEW